MRRARNFNPEWGYLSAPPGIMRTAGLVVVVGAISAAAAAAVVFSLVSQPVTEGSVAARTLVQPTDTIPPVRVSVMLPAELGPATNPVGSDPSKISTTERAAGAAAVAEPPAVTDAPPARADNKAATMGDGTPTQKKPIKKVRRTSAPVVRLRPYDSYNLRAQNGYYWSRGEY
jgi:hypothetical protein